MESERAYLRKIKKYVIYILPLQNSNFTKHVLHVHIKKDLLEAVYGVFTKLYIVCRKMLCQ